MTARYSNSRLYVDFSIVEYELLKIILKKIGYYVKSTKNPVDQVFILMFLETMIYKKIKRRDVTMSFVIKLTQKKIIKLTFCSTHLSNFCYGFE